MPLTAPFGDQRIDVHQQGQQLMGLAEARLIAIERDHDGALEGAMAEPSIAALHQRLVHGRIEDGAIDFASLLDIHEAIVFGPLDGLEQCALHLGGQKLIDALLEFRPEIEALLLQARRALQPTLHQHQQRWPILGAAYRVQRLLIIAKHIRIFLIVFHTLFGEDAQLVLDQSELQRLKARRGRQIFAKVHEIQRSHCLQYGHLIDQQLENVQDIESSWAYKKTC